MQKYSSELKILSLQLFMFYIFPLFAGPTDAIGMVLLIILATFLLSFTLALISNRIIKYFYPIIAALSFIPSVFIYYNESALIHSVWYFIISVCGIGLGCLIKILCCKR